MHFTAPSPPGSGPKRRAQYIFDPYGSDSSSDATSFLTDLLTVIEEVDALPV